MLPKITSSLFTFAFFFIISTPLVSAHQPHYVGTETMIHIPNPTVSRAYYGELNGGSVVYTVSSDVEFSLYLNILSPYLPYAHKDFILRITNALGSPVVTIQAPTSDWKKWYEEFAGDLYWKGPEYKHQEPAGTYRIEVSNPNNTGKYVLAPGEKEVFTLASTPSTIHQIYLVKTRFFNKPWYSLFEGIIGKSLLGLVAVLSVIIIAVFWVLYRRKLRLK